MRIILASGSPRRREILSMLGIDFEIITSDVDESSDVTDPGKLVSLLSARKGLAVRDRLADSITDDTLIISSDTLVYCDGEFLGKPKSRDDARRMLNMMKNNTHRVYSGITLCFGKEKCVSDFDFTEVVFGDMSEDDIGRYLDTFSYSDKAGAYAIQEGAAMFIDGIRGDYFTVVGLPVRKMYRMLADEGIDMQSLTHKK